MFIVIACSPARKRATSGFLKTACIIKKTSTLSLQTYTHLYMYKDVGVGSLFPSQTQPFLIPLDLPA